MHPSNKIIHGLWIGERLSPLELLTLHSFIDKGHEFHLWIYEPLQNDLPEEVICQDANTIIPKEEIFTRQKGDSKKGFGKGSLALFSDLFRYKLLYEKGGWWVDMDVTCLKPFNIETEYYFRAHPILPMIGNVMKCPKNALVMLQTYEDVKEKCDSNTSDWLLSNKILNQKIQDLQLSNFIQSSLSNEDDWLEIERLLYAGHPVKSHWQFIHWMNEEWRSRGIQKDTHFSNSYLAKLFQQYGLNTKEQRVPFTSLGLYYLKEINRVIRTSIKKQVFKS